MSVQYVQNSGGFNPLGILGTVASLAIPGAGPWIAGANALGSALSGDWTGAARSGANALLGAGKTTAPKTTMPQMTTQSESNPNYFGQQLSDLNTSNSAQGNGALNLGGAGSGPDGSTSAWSPKDGQILNTVMSAAGKRPVLSDSDKKYNALLAMNGLDNGGNGQFNREAAQNYYQTYQIGDNPLDTPDNASIFQALMSMYGR